MTCAHEWKRDAQGFIALNDGAMTCEICGHVDRPRFKPGDAMLAGQLLAPKRAHPKQTVEALSACRSPEKETLCDPGACEFCDDVRRSAI